MKGSWVGREKGQKGFAVAAAALAVAARPRSTGSCCRTQASCGVLGCSRYTACMCTTQPALHCTANAGLLRCCCCCWIQPICHMLGLLLYGASVPRRAAGIAVVAVPSVPCKHSKPKTLLLAPSPCSLLCPAAYLAYCWQSCPLLPPAEQPPRVTPALQQALLVCALLRKVHLCLLMIKSHPATLTRRTTPVGPHLGKDTCHCKHGPAGVHALRLGKPLEALGVAAQATAAAAHVHNSDKQLQQSKIQAR